MEIRDAVEADAERLAALTDAPTDVMRNLVHDRTVRVAVETDDDASDGEVEGASDGEVDGTSDGERGGDAGGDDEREATAVRGFVSYDARGSTVHVTQLEGGAELCTRLLSEPVRFADGEGMSVELLATESADAVRTAAEQAAFDEVGPGPRFDGTQTIRFRWTAGE